MLTIVNFKAVWVFLGECFISVEKEISQFSDGLFQLFSGIH